MKILVMGYSGSGKSTLARALGERYGCPVLHLDTIQFQEDWQERDPREAETMAEAFLDGNDSWVIDGSYAGRFAWERRCREADRIIQLLLPRRVCLPRALKRYLQNRGAVRDSMAAGCEEKLDWEFVQWILWGGRRKKYRERYRQLKAQFPDKVLTCTSAGAAARLLRDLEKETPH